MVWPLCSLMYQSSPKLPNTLLRAYPGHLTRVLLRMVGNLTQNEALPVGHLTFMSKCWSAKGSCNPFIQRVDCVHGFLLLYSLFCWSIWEPLATRAGKMGPSCLLRIFRICPARKSFFPLLIKLGWINMSYIGLILLIVFSVVDPGEGPGGGRPGPPYFFRPNWGPKGWKNLFLIPGSPLCQGLDDPPPPPPYLKVWICHWFLLKMQKRTQPIFSHLDLTLGQQCIYLVTKKLHAIRALLCFSLPKRHLP